MEMFEAIRNRAELHILDKPCRQQIHTFGQCKSVNTKSVNGQFLNGAVFQVGGPQIKSLKMLFIFLNQ